MSSESKDELNGECAEKADTEQKNVSNIKIVTKTSAEIHEEHGSLEAHIVGGKNNSAHSDSEKVIDNDLDVKSVEITDDGEKLTNGTRNEPLKDEINSELTCQQGTDEGEVKTDIGFSHNERPDTSEIDRGLEKLKNSPENLDEPVLQQNEKSLPSEVKKNIVESVLNRFIQEARKQNTEVNNASTDIKTICKGNPNSSETDYTEEQKDTHTDVSEPVLGDTQTEVADTKVETCISVKKGPSEMLNSSEIAAGSSDIVEKQSEAHTNLENLEQRKLECTVETEMEVQASNLKSCKTEVHNDSECPHLEPEVPMETDSVPLITECDSSVSEESSVDKQSAGNVKDQSKDKSCDVPIDKICLEKEGKEELVSKIQNKEEKIDKVEPQVQTSKKGTNNGEISKNSDKTENQKDTEKIIMYHEDTVRYIEKTDNKILSCDKENSKDLKTETSSGETKKQDVIAENADTSSVMTYPVTALSCNKAILETKKSPESSSKPKGQKLDELLSKIATKASSNINIPKKAKARKSFSHAGTAAEKAVISNMSVTPASITALTFNVKMLEKQGVLDIPKTQNKRKAFEPFKLKVKQSDNIEKSPVKVSSVRSPVKSPVKSPKDSPFFNTSKVIKGRRRKRKKMGHYRLPSEKKARERIQKSKERKKASEERQTSDDEKSEIKNSECEKQKKNSDIETRMPVEEADDSNNMDCSDTKVLTVKYESQSEPELRQQWKSPLSPNSAKSVEIESKTSPRKQNALDMLTKNSKLSFSMTSNLSTKKAKKTVRPALDHSNQTRTLDSFLKGGSYPRLTSSIQQSQGPVMAVRTGTQHDQDSLNSGVRKRKATEVTHLPVLENSADGQEEKKRKTEIPIGKSPPPMIKIVGSPPLVGGVRPIIPSPVSVSASSPVTITQLTSPNSKQQQKTIIQNGTLNGLPVFQIIPNGNFAPSQLVAIGTQGQSLLPSSLPKTALLQPPHLAGAPPGMPVILTPVPMPTVVSSAVVTQTQNQVSLLSPSSTITLTNKGVLSPVNSSVQGMTMNATVEPIAAPIPISVFNQSIISSHGQMPVLNHILKSPLEQNTQTLKPSHIPNGLYPVTPPRTPDEQAGSDSTSQDSVGVSPGQQVSPDKDIIPLCTCKLNGASFPKLVATVTYCQALDSIDGKAMGCCNRVSNSQLVRPAVKIPFMAVCENHRKRLRIHQCCPGCGHFCTQGKFLQCRNEGNQVVHNFHEQCQVIKDDKNFCPHCGETSLQVEVTLMLQEKKPPTIESKSSRIQLKAKMAIAEKKSTGSGDESSDETVIMLEKTKKILSTSEIPMGPDRHSLERVLSSLAQERPKKYRHLPKCLFTPAYDNDLERVVYMLEDGHDPNEKYDDLEGQGAIHAAAAVGSLPVLHSLIQAGASPHLQDKTLRTPLMFAAENNFPQVVKYLLKAGAVINSKADDGMTALHYAAKAGHVGIIKVLLDTDGLDIDVKDDGGYTPLIWAAEHEQLDVVKFLLKRNADPNLRDSEENTALHWAAFSGSSNVAEVLLSAGCELDSLNMHGDRPLHIASRQDHYECVVLFLARGADVELQNNKGEIPLKCCIDENSPTSLALRVNRQLKGFGAKHMGRPEKLLHRDISKGRENIPIPCVNGIDDDGIPTDYLYVTDNIETKCLNVNRVIGSLQCCQCKDDCSSIYCACGKSSVKCWYDKYGRLLPEFNMLEPSLIFECNRACECWTTCNNRVVQNGVMSRLQVFKTEGRGWGCKTLVNIPRGTFICEYIGEHISDSEADRREDDSYLFDLDNKDGETYCIDARKYGNVARFINHLCEPNLVPVKVFVDSQDLRFPRICLFASRDILAQEELGFDYGEKFWIIKWKHFTCTCGSPKCRYSKDTIQKTLEEYRARHEEDIENAHE